MFRGDNMAARGRYSGGGEGGRWVISWLGVWRGRARGGEWRRQRVGGVGEAARGRRAVAGRRPLRGAGRGHRQGKCKGGTKRSKGRCGQFHKRVLSVVDCSATPSLCGPQQPREAMNEATRRNLGVLSLHNPHLGRPHPTWNATAPSSPSLLDCRRLQPPGTRSQRSCSLGALHALYERACSPAAPCHGV